jgi:hypothetical protein
MVYGQWSQARAETRGVMLNKVGQRAGVNEQSLFTGPESECASTPRLSSSSTSSLARGDPGELVWLRAQPPRTPSRQEDWLMASTQEPGYGHDHVGGDELWLTVDELMDVVADTYAPCSTSRPARPPTPTALRSVAGTTSVNASASGRPLRFRLIGRTGVSACGVVSRPVCGSSSQTA